MGASDTDKIQQMYRDSKAAVRSTFKGDVEKASAHYRRYVDFVLAHATGKPAKILDVGCGAGWSTLLFREAGHDVIGMDLHANAFEANEVSPGLPYQQGDVQHIPFSDSSFDIVCMHAVLEHVPDPPRALTECVRILRPGGRLVFVGPHLVSVGVNLYWAVRHTLRTWKTGKLRDTRTTQTPRHPYGNTVGELWKSSALNIWISLRKLIGEKQVEFRMRVPDDQPPFHADNDACYFCNPMDIVNWANQAPNIQPIRWWPLDRPLARATWPIAGGTWVVVQKSE